MNLCLSVHEVENLDLNCSVLTVGNFDGLHKGHQALIQKTQFLARKHWLKSVVLTFEPHPRQVLKPKALHLSLAGPACLQHQLKNQVDVLWVEKFTPTIARLSPLEFGHYFLKPLKARHIVVGEGFRFAHQRCGTTSVLQQLGQKMGFGVHLVKPVKIEGQMVSSTRVRQALQQGDTKLCRRLLGRDYSVQGKVIKGKQQARRLGFPTLNLKPAHELACRRGVYAGYVELPDLKQKLTSVINYGIKPTFGKRQEPLVEAHILQTPKGQELNLYGKAARCYFTQFLRNEKKFNSPEELKKQIARDVQKAQVRLLRCRPVR